MPTGLLETYLMMGFCLVAGGLVVAAIYIVLRFRMKKAEAASKQNKALIKEETKRLQAQKEIEEIQREIKDLDVLIYQYNMFILAKLGGIRFEIFVGSMLEKLGYTDVCVTQASNDKGGDLIAVEPGGDRKVCFQCKRYSKEVGISSVQEVFSAAKYYECDIAVVVTNSTFTYQAHELAEKIGVDLWDGEYLSAMMQKCQTEVFALLHERLQNATNKGNTEDAAQRTWPKKMYSTEPFSGTGSPVVDYKEIMKPAKQYDATSPIVPESDPLLRDAIKAALEDDEFVSVSELMKKLDIPVDRAKKLIEEMEHKGIIEDQDGPHPRKIIGKQEEIGEHCN